MIQWTIEAALGCELSKNCYVSTNCENIASLSKDCGAKVLFLRPNEFATDESPTYTAIQHMISKLNGEFEFLVLLQLLIKNSEDIDQALKSFSIRSPKQWFLLGCLTPM